MSLRLFIDDGHCEAADADELFAGVVDLYIQDMGGLARMEGPDDTGDEAFADPAEVICIYFDADANVFAVVNDEVRGDAAEGFGEYGRGAAVEESIGLPGALVYRHGRFEIVLAYFGEDDAQVVGHRVVTEGGDIGGRDSGVEPDRHGLGIN